MADLSHNQKLAFVFSLLAAAGGLTALAVYFQNQKTKKVNDEILFLDRQIKGLDLVYKKQRNANANLSQA
jgi:hypothetical protein